MKRFAQLVDALVFMPSRNGKIRLLIEYFREVPDPDRGWALAALSGSLSFAEAKPAAVRALAVSRVDPELFAMSYDYVGDLAETTALIWPERHPQANSQPPGMDEVVTALQAAKRGAVMGLVEGWLDQLDGSGRFAMLKLITGSLRIGVSARLTKTALAEFGNVDVTEVEEVWHSLTPPYKPLFDWLEGRGARPEAGHGAGFRPLMLSHPLEEADMANIDPADFVAEWKWDGIRVQVASAGGERRLYSRAGDDISKAFPDVMEHLTFNAVLDGELLVARDGEVAPFNDLQQRLNRKTVTASMLRDYPGWIRLYDLMMEDGEDLRPLPWEERRRRLERWFEKTAPQGMDLSPLLPFDGMDGIRELRAQAERDAIEGIMLKRRDSSYVAGRPKGLWFKWKRNARLVDAVLMYAQRGHGKRSGYYSDFTFGVWHDGQLVPVGKAYFGFTDAEMVEIDRWVRNHTTKRFGPVREVSVGLVFEVAFDSLQSSNRHKSGVAMRFPRISRIRWDKPANEADHLETLQAMLPQ